MLKLWQKNDLTFYGGVVGMRLSGQQWVFKGLTFIGTTTGVVAGGTDIVFVGCHFENAGTGIDASGTSGSLTVIDSSGTSIGTLVSSYNSGNAGNSIILENIQMTNSGSTVTLNGNTVLSGNVADTWVHGDLVSGSLSFSPLGSRSLADGCIQYTSGNPSKQYVSGQTVTTPRSSVLLSDGKYFTMPPPTYQEYGVDQVINIKSVPGYPVYGDGATDDTANINAILSQYAGCKIIYFPAGTYIVTNTIFVPAGSRIFGDAYASAISAVGSNFWNPDAPTTMVQVGNAGDVGVAQISDMMFTVADVLQGCKLVRQKYSGAGESPLLTHVPGRSQHRRLFTRRRRFLELPLPHRRRCGQQSPDKLRWHPGRVQSRMGPDPSHQHLLRLHRKHVGLDRGPRPGRRPRPDDRDGTWNPGRSDQGHLAGRHGL